MLSTQYDFIRAYSGLRGVSKRNASDIWLTEGDDSVYVRGVIKSSIARNAERKGRNYVNW